jgi:hypothetical protein
LILYGRQNIAILWHNKDKGNSMAILPQMFDRSFKGVDTKLLSLLALLSNKTNEMQLTACFENEYRRHSLFKPLNIAFPF